MITLHRLGQARLPLILNCDLIATVEANPDTVITLVTGGLLVVSESPDEVVGSVRAWRAEIGRQALGVPKVLVPSGGPPPDDPPPTDATPGPPSGLRSV